MSKKLSLSGQSRKTVEEVFNDFVISQTAQGLSETTITTYRCHIHSISKHLDIQKPMNALTKGDLEAMVVSMRKAGLAHNSISSYCRVLRTFLRSACLLALGSGVRENHICSRNPDTFASGFLLFYSIPISSASSAHCPWARSARLRIPAPVSGSTVRSVYSAMAFRVR